uniref:Uncharacterized protein n=1 Tax=Avena sativa TaxID=4498 RepID=A0ACD5W501_AVESA
MAKISSFFIFVAFAMVIVANASTTSIGTEGICIGDMFALIPKCIMYVIGPPGSKVKPSQECCDVWLKVDIPCLCSKVNDDVEATIDMEKVVYIADYCKRPLTPGSKCGTYTVPTAGL